MSADTPPWDIIDGTSNTVASSEAVISPPVQATGSRMFIGMQNVSAVPTSPAALVDASTDPVTVRSGIGACDTAWANPATKFATRRANWAHGSMGFTLFNTVVTPNSQTSKWSYCDQVDSSSMAKFSNANSDQAGGVNTLMADGSVKFIKNSVDRRNWWAIGTKAGGEVVGSDAY